MIALLLLVPHIPNETARSLIFPAYYFSLGLSVSGLVISTWAGIDAWLDLWAARRAAGPKPDAEVAEMYRLLADSSISQALAGGLLHLAFAYLGMIAVTGPAPIHGREVRAFTFALVFILIQMVAIGFQSRSLNNHRKFRSIARRSRHVH